MRFAVLTALVLFCCFGSDAHAQAGGAKRQAASGSSKTAQAAASGDDCRAQLLTAAQLLKDGQYPRLELAAERRKAACPGAVSSFLVGVALAGQIDVGLVGRGAERAVIARAIGELEAALAGSELRPEWVLTASDWLRYLRDRRAGLDAVEARHEPPTPVAAEGTPDPVFQPTYSGERAAAPVRPNLFPWGPVLTVGAGAIVSGVALATFVMAKSRDADLRRTVQVCQLGECQLGPEDEKRLLETQDSSQALHLATTVLLVSGASLVAVGGIWFLLQRDPEAKDEPLGLSVSPGGATLFGRF